MRKKIAKRWRKDVLKKGVVIQKEGAILYNTGRFLCDLRKKDIGCGIIAIHNDWTYHVAAKDTLHAYKILMQAIKTGNVSIACKYGNLY